MAHSEVLLECLLSTLLTVLKQDGSLSLIFPILSQLLGIFTLKMGSLGFTLELFRIHSELLQNNFTDGL